jgi:hypothetical protein
MCHNFLLESSVNATKSYSTYRLHTRRLSPFPPSYRLLTQLLPIHPPRHSPNSSTRLFTRPDTRPIHPLTYSPAQPLTQSIHLLIHLPSHSPQLMHSPSHSPIPSPNPSTRSFTCPSTQPTHPYAHTLKAQPLLSRQSHTWPTTCPPMHVLGHSSSHSHNSHTPQFWCFLPFVFLMLPCVTRFIVHMPTLCIQTHRTCQCYIWLRWNFVIIVLNNYTAFHRAPSAQCFGWPLTHTCRRSHRIVRRTVLCHLSTWITIWNASASAFTLHRGSDRSVYHSI